MTFEAHPHQERADRLTEELLELIRGPEWQASDYGNGQWVAAAACPNPVTDDSIARAKAFATEQRWELFVRTGLLVGQDGRVLWPVR